MVALQEKFQLKVAASRTKMASGSRRAPHGLTAVASTSAAAAANFSGPSSSDDSSNNVGSSDVSLDDGAPVQVPHTLTSIGR